MNPKTYRNRRETLRKNHPDGVILLPGQRDAPRNYPANAYRFRQDSSFLYYIGTDLPNMFAAILPEGETILFGAPENPDDLVWHGPHPVLEDHAREAGVDKAMVMEDLWEMVSGWKKQGLNLHYLPPYRGETTLLLANLLEHTPDEIAGGSSNGLAKAVSEQRSIKTPEEVAEIEEALSISALMYEKVLELIQPGRTEAEIMGEIWGVHLKKDRYWSFPPIVSVHGEILHNTGYENTLEEGQLLLVDCGTESRFYYASDITRTYPVSGKFTPEQKDIYEVVLNSQLAAIENASPARSNKDLHLLAAKTIAAGLKDLGLMKGSVESAVENGAHALFFPHGLGHMLGLDVHDMEDLGDIVGYEEGESRSSQFGLAFLRLAKKLEPGFVISIEPGIYFVPALIDQWQKKNHLSDFINYDKVQQYRGFGGIRIEDDLLITENGSRVLGEPIPKTVAEIEQKLSR